MQSAVGSNLTQNQKVAAGAAVLGLGYYFYSRSTARNVGDAASRAGAATGRQLEAAGEQVGSPTLKDEGRGLQAKQQYGDTKNVGDAVSRAGAAAGRQLEAAGEQVGSQTLKDEGRGLQAKQQ